MAAEPDVEALSVTIQPMRRRHLRVGAADRAAGVPAPVELVAVPVGARAARDARVLRRARRSRARRLRGPDDDARRRRTSPPSPSTRAGTAHKIGTRLLLVLAREAIGRGAHRAHARGADVEHRARRTCTGASGSARRRAQELLPGDQRGRARDVGARGRPARVRRAARRRSSARVPGETVVEEATALVTLDPRHRDVVRRDRGRGGRRRPHRAARRWCRARSTCTPASAAWCPRSPAAPTSS